MGNPSILQVYDEPALAVIDTAPPWQNVVVPAAVAEADATDVMARTTAVLFVPSQPLAVFILAA
jgi:uncharacterized protein YtpQ (UPF0354 family)